jgi:Ran GTPase-activating protein (RanGAP) involved in mRNA processing and transport
VPDSCSIGAEGINQLFDTLDNNRTLQSLSLKHNNFGTLGAQAIGRVLPKTVIENLYLSRNTMSALGAQAIGRALPNTSVNSLYLNECNIGDEAAIALFESLENNAALEGLDLENNNIGDAGAAAIGRAGKYFRRRGKLGVDF